MSDTQDLEVENTELRNLIIMADEKLRAALGWSMVGGDQGEFAISQFPRTVATACSVIQGLTRENIGLHKNLMRGG